MRKLYINTIGLIAGALVAQGVLNATFWALPVQDGLFIGDTDPD